MSDIQVMGIMQVVNVELQLEQRIATEQVDSSVKSSAIFQRCPTASVVTYQIKSAFAFRWREIDELTHAPSKKDANPAVKNRFKLVGVDARLGSSPPFLLFYKNVTTPLLSRRRANLSTLKNQAAMSVDGSCRIVVLLLLCCA